MSHQVTRNPEVRRDIVELADYISRGNAERALQFLDAIEETFRLLAANNQVGELCPFTSSRAIGMRVWPVQGFRNHLIFYRPIANGVDIVRVLHGARNIEQLLDGA